MGAFSTVQQTIGASGAISSSPVERPTVPAGSWADSRAYASCASWRSGAA
jgi:hypothetical protein